MCAQSGTGVRHEDDLAWLLLRPRTQLRPRHHDRESPRPAGPELRRSLPPINVTRVALGYERSCLGIRYE
jgi:hypothetical protein